MEKYQQNVSLKDYNTWAVGGWAQYFFLPKTEIEIIEAQKWALDRKLPVYILGGGSNVLISDQGLKGLTLCLKNYNQIKVQEDPNQISIFAESGTSKSELLRIFLKHQLAPALFLAGLPGDVGGGVVMNAGVSEALQPKEFAEIITSVTVIKPDGQIKKYLKNEIQWSYRHSLNWQPGIISSVQISWPMQKNPSILVQVKELNRKRLQNQPLDLPSCGSVFVNPPGLKAAALIDSCGLKGYTVGGAQVSKKHANFIVNINQATAEETKQVIQHVQKTVLEKTQVQLKTEVVYMGEFQP